MLLLYVLLSRAVPRRKGCGIRPTPTPPEGADSVCRAERHCLADAGALLALSHHNKIHYTVLTRLFAPLSPTQHRTRTRTRTCAASAAGFLFLALLLLWGGVCVSNNNINNNSSRSSSSSRQAAPNARQQTWHVALWSAAWTLASLAVVGQFLAQALYSLRLLPAGAASDDDAAAGDGEDAGRLAFVLRSLGFQPRASGWELFVALCPPLLLAVAAAAEVNDATAAASHTNHQQAAAAAPAVGSSNGVNGNRQPVPVDEASHSGGASPSSSLQRDSVERREVWRSTGDRQRQRQGPKARAADWAVAAARRRSQCAYTSAGVLGAAALLAAATLVPSLASLPYVLIICYSLWRWSRAAATATAVATATAAPGLQALQAYLALHVAALYMMQTPLLGAAAAAGSPPAAWLGLYRLSFHGSGDDNNGDSTVLVSQLLHLSFLHLLYLCLGHLRCKRAAVAVQPASAAAAGSPRHAQAAASAVPSLAAADLRREPLLQYHTSQAGSDEEEDGMGLRQPLLPPPERRPGSGLDQGESVGSTASTQQRRAPTGPSAVAAAAAPALTAMTLPQIAAELAAAALPLAADAAASALEDATSHVGASCLGPSQVCLTCFEG